MELTKVEYIKVCIKERLKAANHPPSSCELSDKRVKTTILRSLCDDTSADHYSHHIRRLTEGEASWDTLRRDPNRDTIPRTDESANTLINIFKRLWSNLPKPGDLEQGDPWQPDYICSVTEKKDPSPKEHRSQHISIMNKLMYQFITKKPTESISNNLPVISQLLSLAYCILRCCHNRANAKKNPHKPYIHLRQFLSDMVITFLLKSIDESKDYVGLCKLSCYNFQEIEKVEIHLSISPQNPVFQELVLQEILEILYDDQVSRVAAEKEDTQGSRIEGLAHLVYEYFSKLISRVKASDTLCCIICNQSRYMATGSPLLKEYIKEHVNVKIMKFSKNFVSERTAQAVIKKANAVPYFESIIKSTEERDTKSIVTLWNHYSVSQHCGDICEPIELKNFNILHHVILMEAVNKLQEFLKEPLLELDRSYWFIDDNGRMKLKKILSDLVKKLYTKLIEFKQSQTHNALAEVHKLMSNLAISLQYIIYIRWFLCENHEKAGIDMNKGAAKHQKVIFLLLALRTLIMYLLPIRICTNGLANDSKYIPMYVCRLQFKLDIYCFPYA